MAFNFVVGLSLVGHRGYNEFSALQFMSSQEALDYVCSKLLAQGYYVGSDYQVVYVHLICSEWSVSEQFVAQNREGA